MNMIMFHFSCHELQPKHVFLGATANARPLTISKESTAVGEHQEQHEHIQQQRQKLKTETTLFKVL